MQYEIHKKSGNVFISRHSVFLITFAFISWESKTTNAFTFGLKNDARQAIYLDRVTSNVQLSFLQKKLFPHH